jgi:hypothetical protein
MHTSTLHLTKPERAPNAKFTAAIVAPKEIFKEPFTRVSAKDTAAASKLAIHGRDWVSQR